MSLNKKNIKVNKLNIQSKKVKSINKPFFATEELTNTLVLLRRELRRNLSEEFQQQIYDEIEIIEKDLNEIKINIKIIY